MFSSVLKYFIILILGFYVYIKLTSQKILIKELLILPPYILISSIITYLVKNTLAPLNVIFMFLTFFIYVSFRFKHNLKMSAVLSLFSIEASWIFNTISAWLSSPFLYIFYITIGDIHYINVNFWIIAGIIQFLCVFFFFKIKRFANLYCIIEKDFTNSIGLILGTIVLLSISMIYNMATSYFMFSVTVLIILFGVLLVLLIKKYILNEYLNKANKRNIHIMEKTLSEQNELINKLTDENEKLSRSCLKNRINCSK